MDQFNPVEKRRIGKSKIRFSSSGLTLNQQYKLSESISNGGDKYLDKIRYLKSFSRNSKQKVEMKSHKLDWKKLWISMLKTEKTLYQDIVNYTELHSSYKASRTAKSRRLNYRNRILNSKISKKHDKNALDTTPKPETSLFPEEMLVNNATIVVRDNTINNHDYNDHDNDVGDTTNNCGKGAAVVSSENTSSINKKQVNCDTNSIIEGTNKIVKNDIPSKSAYIGTSTNYVCTKTDHDLLELQQNLDDQIVFKNNIKGQVNGVRDIYFALKTSSNINYQEKQLGYLKLGELFSEVKEALYSISMQLEMEYVDIEESVNRSKKNLKQMFQEDWSRTNQDSELVQTINRVGGNSCPDEFLKHEIISNLINTKQQSVQKMNDLKENNIYLKAQDRLNSWSKRDSDILQKILRSHKTSISLNNNTTFTPNRSRSVSSNTTIRIANTVRSNNTGHNNDNDNNNCTNTNNTTITGTSDKVLYKRIQIELPDKSIHEIKLQCESWFQYRFYLNKKKDIMSNWERQKENLVHEARSKFKQCRLNYEKKMKSWSSMMETRTKQIKLHKQLDAMEALRNINERIKSKIEFDHMKAMAASNAMEHERLLQHRQRIKEELLEYRNAKKEKELELEAQRQQVLKDKLAAIEAQSGFNQERIDYRVKLAEAKRDWLYEIEKERASQERERFLTLEKLKATVPYKDKIDSIQIDPERSRKHTIASNLDNLDTVPLFKAGGNGYTIETLFKDVRFKIGLALRDAGVSGSEHARNMLAAIKPSRELAIHTPSIQSPWISNIASLKHAKY